MHHYLSRGKKTKCLLFTHLILKHNYSNVRLGHSSKIIREVKTNVPKFYKKTALSPLTSAKNHVTKIKVPIHAIKKYSFIPH